MTLRTTFYSLVLALALTQTAFGCYLAVVHGFSPYLYIFGKLAASFSVLTWIWVSVLLSYNNRPNSTHRLTKVSTHLFSFMSFVPIWLALGIMIFTQCPYECDFSRYSDGEASGWCGVSAATGVTSVFISTLSATSALVIQRGGHALGENIAEGSSTVIGNPKA